MEWISNYRFGRGAGGHDRRTERVPGKIRNRANRSSQWIGKSWVDSRSRSRRALSTNQTLAKRDGNRALSSLSRPSQLNAEKTVSCYSGECSSVIPESPFFISRKDPALNSGYSPQHLYRKAWYRIPHTHTDADPFQKSQLNPTRQKKKKRKQKKGIGQTCRSRRTSLGRMQMHIITGRLSVHLPAEHVLSSLEPREGIDPAGQHHDW